MSYQATTWVMEFSKSRLADRLVLGAIAHRISNDNGEAWPSVATIAREANVSERSVHYSIANLQALGELQVRVGNSRKGTNIYRMPKFVTWVQSLHPPVQSKARGVQSTTFRGAKVAPEPSLNLHLRQPEVTCEACGFSFPKAAYRKHQENCKPRLVPVRSA